MRAPRSSQKSPAAVRPTVHTAPLLLGALFLLVSIALSGALAAEHLGGLALPGCGESSGCNAVTRGFWGSLRIGGLAWPVSYLGLSWFVAALVAWLATRGALPKPVRYLVRVGVLVSVGFLAILVAEKHFCPYCVGSHVGNFAFWITTELTRRAARPGRRGLVAVAIGFVASSLVLGALEAAFREAVARKAGAEREESTRQIVEASHRGTSAPATRAGAPSSAPTPPITTRTTTAPATSAPTSRPTSAPAPQAGFTGRYRLGPAAAPIRIVIITDYQCPDCYNIEQQLERLLKERTDLSLSIKHFPFCQDCNPVVKKTLHQNACWAARAAEAAGILWGDEGFFKMHFWLFARKGLFQTTQELEDGIRALGYDPQRFTQMMASEEPLRRIQADSREAAGLGLFYTPMVFINGVELKGILVPDALWKTVQEVAATNPPARTCADDRPPNAFERYLADWREERPRPRLADKVDWARGDPEAKLRVVVWGDYQESNSAKADAQIRAFIAAHPDATYSYRHYPFDQTCNPGVTESRFPQSCRAARAAEAAGQLGGKDAFWALHAWLMGHPGPATDEALRAAAAEAGLDANALLAKIDDPQVTQAVNEDVQAGKSAGIRSIPTVLVNERLVPRWLLDGYDVLGAILTEAAGVSADAAPPE
jgi:protein-disulfide isomerase/uncharacterized membrane protein